MADFDPPFAHIGNRRFPSADERVIGYPCISADRSLFAGLRYAQQSEIGEVIRAAGLTPSNADLTQLRKAINIMIADAIYEIDLPESPPDPDTSEFVRLNLARQRLPFFPYIMTATGRAGVYSPGVGQVRIPGGVWVSHRGIYQFSTHEVDLATQPNKTYHVRWVYGEGYVLRDLADGDYNPGTLAEDNAAFDSSYDDMLMARAVTTANNSVLITDLANRPAYSAQSLINLKVEFTPGWDTWLDSGLALNWARTPTLAEVGFRLWKSNVTDVDGRRYPITAVGVLNSLGIRKTTVNRYACGNVQHHYNDTIPNNGHVHVEWTVEA